MTAKNIGTSCAFIPVSADANDFVVASAPTGKTTPENSGISDGKTYTYYAQSSDGSQWEAGSGAYVVSSHTQKRTTIVANSDGTATAVSFLLPPTVFIFASAAPTLESPFQPNTVMLFWQAAAPIGWTKLTTQNDKALRVVSGSGGVSGGTNAFSTVMAQTTVGAQTLSIAQLAQHNHPPEAGWSNIFGDAAGGGIGPPTFNCGSGFSFATQTGNTGSGSSHNHTMLMSVQYIDLILCQKN